MYLNSIMGRMADGPTKDLDSSTLTIPDSLTKAVLQIDIGKHPMFATFDDSGKISAKRAINSLQAAVREGHLDIGKVKRILDFGAGFGGSTFALACVAEVIEADVEAVEISAEKALQIVSSDILSADKVYIGDGRDFLSKIRPGNEYDLITGFMFGPDGTNASLFQEVALASNKALSPHGYLLINSDMRTAAEIERVAEVNKMRYDRIQMQGVGRELPTTLIFPQAEVAKLAY